MPAIVPEIPLFIIIFKCYPHAKKQETNHNPSPSDPIPNQDVPILYINKRHTYKRKERSNKKDHTLTYEKYRSLGIPCNFFYISINKNSHNLKQNKTSNKSHY